MCHDSSVARSWATPSSAVPGSAPGCPQRVLEQGLSVLLSPQQHRAAPCCAAPAPGTLCRAAVRALRAIWVSAPQVPRGSQHTATLGGGRKGETVPAKKLFKHRHCLGQARAAQGSRLLKGRVGSGAGGRREKPSHFSPCPSSPSSAPAASRTSPSPRSAPLRRARRSSAWRRTSLRMSPAALALMMLHGAAG